MDKYAPFVWASYAAAGVGLAFVAIYAVWRLRAASQYLARELALKDTQEEEGA